MSERPEIDDHTGIETTGHSWDGIKELNSPLPRWWLWLFYASIAWSLIYFVFMPAIPGLPGSNWFSPGIRGESERINVVRDLEALRAERAPLFDELARLSPVELVADENAHVLRFALAAGESAFGDNCSTCHGQGGQGARGYPNLNDDVWLWDGSLDGIRSTLVTGIRSTHPDTRYSQMPAFGRDGLLSRTEIADMTELVVSLSGGEADAAAVTRAQPIYQAQCATCHGVAGLGDPSQGAPNLTDAEWLYGGDRETITESIVNARFGVMPYWEDRLDAATIDALAIYVASLDGDLSN